MIPRTIFLKLEQEVRCTLWVPEPGTDVVLLRTGLLRHLDRYMLQLRILPPSAPKTPAEMDAEEAAAEAARREEEEAKRRDEEEAKRKEDEARAARQRQRELAETMRLEEEARRRAEAKAEAELKASIATEQSQVLINEAGQLMQAVAACTDAAQRVAAQQEANTKMQQIAVLQQHAAYWRQMAAQCDVAPPPAAVNGVEDSPPEQGGRKKRGRPGKEKKGEQLDPEAERAAAEAAKAKAAAEAVARKEARDAQYALDYQAFTESMVMYKSLQQDAAHQQLSKQVRMWWQCVAGDNTTCVRLLVWWVAFFCGTLSASRVGLQWMALRDEIRALNPVQRYSVASIAYRRCLNQSLMANLEDTAADPASWPVCWLLLEPAEGTGLAGGEVPPSRLAVPLHVDANLPDFMVVVRGRMCVKCGCAPLLRWTRQSRLC